MQTGAATLDAGSGFESVHKKSTQCTLTFFGLQLQSLETYFNDSTLRYGGNGIFYLENKVGKEVTTSSGKKSSSTSIYLDATAESTAPTPGGGVLLQR